MLSSRWLCLPTLCLALAVAGTTRAADLLPAERSVEEAIDNYVDTRLQQDAVTPAPPIDDAGFIRRVTLDLAGRVPTMAEVQAFVQSSAADKKAALVDRLLASPDFAFHQRNELDLLLVGGRTNGEWREWLLKAAREGRAWPQLFKEVILAREDDPAQKPAATFLKNRATNVDDLTNDTSKIFFGVSINCAKCHDHPLVPDWTQDHYFGMASFFNRMYLTKKGFLAERDEGMLKFRPKTGPEKQATLMFLTGATITEPALPDLTEEQKKAAEERRKAENESEAPPPPPGYSRRAMLVEAALKPDAGGFFPRSFVNRAWARLMGEGLVTPLDQMHSENEPSHPELLTWLARDAEAHGYDLKRLMRGIVLSRAYGRSSRWEAAGERPSPKLHAVASVRPLTPMQFSLSLAEATANPAELAQRLEKPEEWSARRNDLENHAWGFAQQIEIPAENFQVGVDEALLFANNQHIEQDFLRDSTDRLVGVLKGTSSRQQAIETAFLAVFARLPAPEELDAITGYLATREDRPVAALQQVVWSLLTSGEFRFNY